MNRPSRLVRSAGLAAMLSGSFAPVRGQVQEQRLAAPDARFPEAFGSVSGLLELPDGRVMVADGLGQVLVVVDMGAGQADTIGRPGAGPEEYRQPDGIFPLPGDSVLLVDLGNGRLTALGPDFGFGRTWPISEGEMGPGGGTMAVRVPLGTDSRGRVYFRGMPPMRPGGALPDSGYVLRWDRSAGGVDTLGRVKIEDRTTSSRGGANNQMVAIRPVPMSPQDGWAAGWDGRVAVVRSADYRVEWIGTDGRIVRGPQNEYRPLRIGRADKEAWVDRMQRTALSLMVENVNGRVSTSFRRGGGGSDQPDIDSYQWPDVMPAFQPGGVRVSRAGEVWVERYVSAGTAPTFDVFDGNGRLVRRVILPDGRQLVGFGRNAVYVTRADEYDLLFLEKYRL